MVLEAAFPAQLAADVAELGLLAELHQGAQAHLNGLPFAAGTSGLHGLLHQGVVDDDVGAHGLRPKDVYILDESYTIGYWFALNPSQSKNCLGGVVISGLDQIQSPQSTKLQSYFLPWILQRSNTAKFLELGNHATSVTSVGTPPHLGSGPVELRISESCQGRCVLLVELPTNIPTP